MPRREPVHPLRREELSLDADSLRQLLGYPAVFLDTPQVSGFRWSGCRDGSEVVHFRINGGDHQAPRTIAGRPFVQVAWDFFAAHPLPG